jgi:hypothetical protein
MHEMLHTLKSKRGRGGLIAANIDIEKAFDKMEWSFLLKILTKLGFSSKVDPLDQTLHFHLLIFSASKWQRFQVIFPILGSSSR